MLISKYFHKSLSRFLMIFSLVNVQSWVIFFWTFVCFCWLSLFPCSPSALMWTSSDFSFRFRVWWFWNDLLTECCSGTSAGPCYLSIKFLRSGFTTYSSVISAPQPTPNGRSCPLKSAESLMKLLSVLTGHISDSFKTFSPVRERRSYFRQYIHQWRFNSS